MLIFGGGPADTFYGLPDHRHPPQLPASGWGDMVMGPSASKQSAEGARLLFKRLAHVCLNVTDLQRSLAYYKKLGFKEGFQFTRKGRDFGRYLEITDKVYIEIFEEPGRGPVVNNG